MVLPTSPRQHGHSAFDHMRAYICNPCDRDAGLRRADRRRSHTPYRRIAVSVSLFGIIALVSRTANSLQGPFIAKRVELDIARHMGRCLLGDFRLFLLTATVASIVGAFPIPTFQRYFSRAVDHFRFFAARAGDDIIGAVRFELEDPFSRPEVEAGTSAFVHKLAVRRSWAKKGVSTALLAFARERAHDLDRQYLRLDCVSDRSKLRAMYGRFGFVLHNYVQKGARSMARYELAITD